MEQENYNQEKGITFSGCLKAIVKRKFFVLTLVVLSMIMAGVFSFFSEEVYQVDGLLEVGLFDNETVQSSGVLVEEIKAGKYKNLVIEKLEMSEEEYPEIKIDNPKNTNLLEMKIYSAEPEKAKEILEKNIELISEFHQKKINQKISSLERQKEILQEKITFLEKEIERINHNISFQKEEQVNIEAKINALQAVLIYQQDPGSQFALFDSKEKLESKRQEIEESYSKIDSVEKEISNVKNEINSLDRRAKEAQPTLNLKPITISSGPVKPQPLINIAIAGALGLFIGSFWALGREWWQDIK
jgi:uncharacterized protein involved in exopolysaccharide biosynthesis